MPPVTPLRKLRRESLGFAIGSLCFALGALLFNVSTGSALYKHLTAEQAHDHVWRPDAYGSACFLIASALAIQATTHREGLWDPEARNWWSTWLNMAGSIAFGASAVASYVVPSSGEVLNAQWVNLGTFIGALCFLVAALLVRPPRATLEAG